ncbi:MAG TPA: Gfo/Idh/MocA family oxidoreductase [Cytophagaceae bacterium]|jgi:predicted dehydrogenase|nr:Gfo/Idh/MocA family oxidoreductase [Cytophagaceae bacterium]
MANNLNKKVILIGPGAIAKDYVKTLKALQTDITVLGRNAERCAAFAAETGVPCLAVDLEEYLKKQDHSNTWFIIAVSMDNLGIVSRTLIQQGAKNILIEKPAAVSPEDMGETIALLKNTSITPYVAYNRRFYSSVRQARKMIAEQGGLLSFSFEFTEWIHVIEKLPKTKEVLANWFLGNSTHVVDCAFFVGGSPTLWSAYTAGHISWHPTAAQFSGAGVSKSGALFSYQANWQSAGRWGIEFNTPEGKIILRPMEKLAFQKRGEIQVNPVELDDILDVTYKPGLYLQTQAFLNGDHQDMISLQDHYQNVLNIYQKINGA